MLLPLVNEFNTVHNVVKITFHLHETVDYYDDMFPDPYSLLQRNRKIIGPMAKTFYVVKIIAILLNTRPFLSLVKSKGLVATPDLD